MAFELRDQWVWDFWIAENDARYHLFYLQAPRALGNPKHRHANASIGHATSSDLINWTEAAVALEPGYPGEWDDYATWTGSVIQHDGRWWMFYTGSSTEEKGLVQRIGAAVSNDLTFWVKHPGNPLLTAHPYWYEQFDKHAWHDEAWRDPWVYPIADGFEMLLTARVNKGHKKGRGVIGRGFSQDLNVWTAVPPLTAPGGFGQMEVPQRIATEHGEGVLFSCDRAHLAPERAALGDTLSDCYYLPLDGSDVPHPASDAFALDLPNLYAPRAVKDPSGNCVILGVEVEDESGGFAGRICDPIPLDSAFPASRSETDD